MAYIPDVGEVREAYWACTGDPRRGSEAWDEFDRWLTEERAKVWDEAVQHQWTHRPIGNRSPHNPYREG